MTAVYSLQLTLIVIQDCSIQLAANFSSYTGIEYISCNYLLHVVPGLAPLKAGQLLRRLWFRWRHISAWRHSGKLFNTCNVNVNSELDWTDPQHHNYRHHSLHPFKVSPRFLVVWFTHISEHHLRIYMAIVLSAKEQTKPEPSKPGDSQSMITAASPNADSPNVESPNDSLSAAD